MIMADYGQGFSATSRPAAVWAAEQDQSPYPGLG
jgi:hypothetical protein